MPEYPDRDLPSEIPDKHHENIGGHQLEIQTPPWHKVSPPYTPPDAEWALVARAFAREVDPGQELEIELYFSGWGRPDAAKLTYYFPKGLVDDDRESLPLEVLTTLAYKVERLEVEGKIESRETAFEAPQKSKLRAVGGYTILSPGNFLPDLGRHGLKDINLTSGERPWPSGSPVRLRAPVSQKAQTGSHTITFVLTYVRGARVKSSMGQIEIHVRPIWKRWWVQVAVIASALVALVSGVVALVPWLRTLPWP